MVDATGKQANQTEMLLAIQDLKSSIVGELAKNKDPFWWRAVQVALPIVLTASLGFFVWYGQSKIQNTINEQAAQFAAELSLKQFVFERRLDAYNEVYKTASDTYLSMRAENPQVQDQLDDLDDKVKMLSTLANKSKILSSTALQSVLRDMWLEAAQRRDLGTTESLLDRVAKQMRADLKIDEIDVPPTVSGQAVPVLNR